MPQYKIETFDECKPRYIQDLIDLHSRTFNTDPSSVRVARQYIQGYCLYRGEQFKTKPVRAFITADIEFKGSQDEWQEYCFEIVRIFRDTIKIREIRLPSRPDLEFTIGRLEGTPLEKVTVKRKGKLPKKKWADEISKSGQLFPRPRYPDLQLPGAPVDNKQIKDKSEKSFKPSKPKRVDVPHLPEDDKRKKEKTKDKKIRSLHIPDQFPDLPDVPGLPQEPKKGKEKKSSKLVESRQLDYSSSDFDLSEKSKPKKHKSSDKEEVGQDKPIEKGREFKDPKKDKKKRKRVKFDPKNKTSEVPHWADAGDDTHLSSLYEGNDDHEDASNSEPCCEDGDATHKVEYREEKDTLKKTPCCDYGR